VTTLDEAVAEFVTAAVQSRADEMCRPELVNQRSVARIVGLPAVDFLEDARAGAFESWKVRRLVFARTADVLAWIRKHPAKPRMVAANDAGDAEAEAFARYGARRVSR